MTVEYDGSEFCGFQWQPAVRTVAGTLETTLSRLFCEPVKVTGAGRTDSGVHATGQVVSLTTGAAFAFDRLTLALNALLPADCRVRETAIVGSDFSARFSARARTYVYAILNQAQPSALLARYAWHVSRPLDRSALREAARAFVGEHDFRSFCALPPGRPDGSAGSTTRRIARFNIESRGALLRLEVQADGFLHHMVRTLVGAAAECAMGRRRPEEIAAVLMAAERSAAPFVAPAAGLYLAGVRYEDGYDSFAEPPILAQASPLDGERPFP